jgi:hypothetical protein
MASEKQGGPVIPVAVIAQTHTHTPTIASCNGTLWITIGFSADLVGHSEWDETEVLLPDTMNVGSISVQDTSHEGATEQSSVLLHMCVVLFVNHSCIFVDVNAALLFHISSNG